ncbi:prophage tail fiber N-terminal domain-containing protein [Escherichia coli]|nr:prophage tail fiber N-terminal domain-containing protein [Escherichia coli]MCV4992556.1 prophage tail fiber N-terminal domain-containing protein [Escherichia coli]MCX9948631.1 prophage tail fiber N-terminal domain-containing protein [Escherichia coli]
MAAVKISGVLKDGAGKPIQNCTIQLKAKRNSTTVVVNTVASENPDEAGRYSMDVEYGQYSVILLVEGFPPSHAGAITVYEDSKPGTLNDFLGAATEDDVRPEALYRFEKMVEEVARNAEAASQSAAAAKKSETAAASSRNAAKTSETNAGNSAKAAASSKTAAQNAATAAERSETNARASEEASAGSEEASRRNAESAAENAGIATTKAREAAADATTAGQKKDEALSAATRAEKAADRAEAAAEVTAEPYVNIVPPLPDVWIPFNDSLDMITGFSPSYKKIVIGDDEITMPGDKIVKFKRASTATYINKSGQLKLAEVDEPRFERDGLLIEGQRTNYFRNSNTPEAWNNTGSVSVESFDSDKGFNYGRITVINENPTAQGYQAIAVNTNDAYTCPAGSYTTISCLTKSDNSRCRARFGKMSDNGAFVFHSDAVLDPVTGNVVHGNNVTVTAERVGEWWLFTATLFADAEMIISSRFEILAMPGISIIPNGSTLDIAMPQAEIGSYRTSFIITEGAPGTRSSDMVTIPVRNNIHRLPFSALVEVNKNWDIPPSKSPLIFNVKDYQENGLFTHGFRGNNFSDAGSPFISMGGCNKYVATTQRKIISGFRCGADGDVQAVCNGELSVAAKTTWTSIVPRAVLRIGGQGTNGEYHLFGHIRNLRIWHKELTDAQMGESIK